MKMLPKISIVTPSLNQGQFIERTIISVLIQDYPNIEYIVMDGGSTDNTQEILKKYDDRLIWKSEPDTGQSNAINTGFKIATGEIISWINSDDFYDKNTFFFVAQHFLKCRKCSLLYGNLTHVDMNGQFMAYYSGPNLDINKLIHIDPHGIRQPATFFRRSALMESGLLDENLFSVMDYDLFIRLGRIDPFCFINKNLAFYRFHENAKSIRMDLKIKQAREILQVSRKYGGKITDPIIFKLLKHISLHFLRLHTKDYLYYVRIWRKTKSFFKQFK